MAFEAFFAGFAMKPTYGLQPPEFKVQVQSVELGTKAAGEMRR